MTVLSALMPVNRMAQRPNRNLRAREMPKMAENQGQMIEISAVKVQAARVARAGFGGHMLVWPLYPTQNVRFTT